MTIDTDLRDPSPLTPDLIDRILANHASPLVGIGCAVCMASAKYRISATYILAHAIHETGWGRSRISRDKKNLFGWSAFDGSPYDSATGFPTYGQCIDYVMGRVNKLYLTPGGKYYNGETLRGMNVNYATDKQWGEKIARIGTALEVSAAALRA